MNSGKPEPIESHSEPVLARQGEFFLPEGRRTTKVVQQAQQADQQNSPNSSYSKPSESICGINSPSTGPYRGLVSFEVWKI
jgi:beta-lactamase class D